MTDLSREQIEEYRSVVVGGSINEKLCDMALAKKDAEERADYLQLQAGTHAQEARTANATIHEIYQLCTGATGEPGSWNGAEPVRQLLQRAQRAEAAVQALVDVQHGPPKARYEDMWHAAMSKAIAVINATPPPEGETSHVPPIMNNTPDGKPDEIPDTPEQTVNQRGERFPEQTEAHPVLENLPGVMRLAVRNSRRGGEPITTERVEKWAQELEDAVADDDTPEQARHEKRDSYLNLAGRIIEQRGGDNRSLDNALDSFNEVMADFHELTGLDPNANPKVGQIREALTAGDTPERDFTVGEDGYFNFHAPKKAHGDALAALNRIALIVYDEESPEPTFVGDMADEDFDVVRRHPTASGVPYSPPIDEDAQRTVDRLCRAAEKDEEPVQFGGVPYVPDEVWRLLQELRTEADQHEQYRESLRGDNALRGLADDHWKCGETKLTIATRLERALASAPADGLTLLEREDWGLVPVNVPTGADDYDVEWTVIEYHMAKPHERVIGRGKTPKDALSDAAAPQRGGE